MNVIVAITKHVLYACFYSVVVQILKASKDVGKKNGCAKDVGYCCATLAFFVDLICRNIINT